MRRSRLRFTSVQPPSRQQTEIIPRKHHIPLFQRTSNARDSHCLVMSKLRLGPYIRRTEISR